MADELQSSPSARVSRAAPQPHVAVTSEEYTAPVGGMVEGRAYLIDGHLVIADATVGASAKVHGRTGVIEYAKVHEQEWTSGEPVYWDAYGGCLSTSATSVDGTSATIKVGVVDRDAPRPSVTGFARLDAKPSR